MSLCRARCVDTMQSTFSGISQRVLELELPSVPGGACFEGNGFGFKPQPLRPVRVVAFPEVGLDVGTRAFGLLCKGNLHDFKVKKVA